MPYEKAYEKGFEDMRHRKPNIDKLGHYINFKPKVTLDRALRNIIDAFET